jgi:HNH endonuclease
MNGTATHCRYCRIRTINSGGLALRSSVFPTELPVHPNWRADTTHPVYLLQFTTNDHIIPVTKGGHPCDPDNLVTACWPGNAAKADLPLEALRGWRLRVEGEADTSWHGLADPHEALWRELGEPALTGVAKQWLTLNQRRYGRPGRLDPPPALLIDTWFRRAHLSRGARAARGR